MQVWFSRTLICSAAQSGYIPAISHFPEAEWTDTDQNAYVHWTDLRPISSMTFAERRQERGALQLERKHVKPASITYDAKACFWLVPHLNLKAIFSCIADQYVWEPDKSMTMSDSTANLEWKQRIFNDPHQKKEYRRDSSVSQVFCGFHWASSHSYAIVVVNSRRTIEPHSAKMPCW